MEAWLRAAGGDDEAAAAVAAAAVQQERAQLADAAAVQGLLKQL